MKPEATAKAEKAEKIRLALPLVAGLLFIFFAYCLQIPRAQAAEAKNFKSQKENFTVKTVADGLQHPWSLAFLPNGDMLVTEREGRLRFIKDGKLQAAPVKGAPKVLAEEQGGLLGIALHPKFAENQFVYLAYSAGKRQASGTEVARAKFNGASLEDLTVIFKAEPKVNGSPNPKRVISAHYGGRLLFAPDGNLFISLGDRYGFRDRAQNLDAHLGKIIRIKDDGSAPDDNPFKGQAGAKPEIYTYGHRNVQGLALRPGTSQIWISEFGPLGGDELNLLKPGANYGWPKITYGIDYDGSVISDKTEAPGMEQPVVKWAPSISPSGITFYDGDKFPNWKGNLFIANLGGAHLRRLTFDGDRVVAQEELLADLDERLRDVVQGPDGLLYLLTDDPANGRVLKLEPTPAS